MKPLLSQRKQENRVALKRGNVRWRQAARLLKADSLRATSFFMLVRRYGSG